MPVRAVPVARACARAGFGMEAEVTGKLLRRRIRPYEVPISYRARGREEGKKITWKDGVEAIWILGRERARRRPTGASPADRSTPGTHLIDRRRPSAVQAVPPGVVGRGSAVPAQVGLTHPERRSSRCGTGRPVAARRRPGRRSGQVGLDQDHLGRRRAPAARPCRTAAGVWVYATVTSSPSVAARPASSIGPTATTQRRARPRVPDHPQPAGVRRTRRALRCVGQPQVDRVVGGRRVAQQRRAPRRGGRARARSSRRSVSMQRDVAGRLVGPARRPTRRTRRRR